MKKAAAVSGALVAVLGGIAAAQPPNLPLIAYEAPVVPELVTDGIAIVAFTVRANGRVADAIALAATERGLAHAARNAVLNWRFERDPVLGRGRDAEPSAVLRREIIEFVFKRDGVVSSLSHMDGAKTWFPQNQSLAVRTVLPDQIDTPLARVPAIASAEVAELVASVRVAGRAIVSFVIDESGGVRVPIVVAADDPSLHEPALAVVGEWRYEPSTQRGEPVSVEERNTLTFRPQQPPE